MDEKTLTGTKGGLAAKLYRPDLDVLEERGQKKTKMSCQELTESRTWEFNFLQGEPEYRSQR